MAGKRGCCACWDFGHHWCGYELPRYVHLTCQYCWWYGERTPHSVLWALQPRAFVIDTYTVHLQLYRAYAQPTGDIRPPR